MIILFHDNIKIVDVSCDYSHVNKSLLKGKEISKVLFSLAEENLESLIMWSHYKLKNHLNLGSFSAIFHHQKILASYSTTGSYSLKDDIGYIDEKPFINVNPNVKYPTWLMSSNVGGAYGKVLARFQFLLSHNLSFIELLNYIGKLGQEKGLFCYSEPRLLKQIEIVEEPKSNLFCFVKNFYKKRWLFILLFNKFIYENQWLLKPFFKSIIRTRFSKKSVNFDDICVKSKNKLGEFSIDVIIPTIGRKDYLKAVLSDLANQTILPKSVIIVEQKIDGISELDFLNQINYPFEIDHVCISTLGACNARNIALKKVASNWVFFADDDISIEKNTIQEAKKLIGLYGIKALTISCLQKGESDIVNRILQSPNFGSGTSIVNRQVLSDLSFKKEHELGYGEDIDFGMQIRNKGVDIMYTPFIKMLHHKAPIGGFRTEIKFPWSNDKIKPKPFPTVMAYKIKHYTQKQLRGYKTILFVKFYKHQKIKNPITYIKSMNKRWAISRKYAEESMKIGSHDI